MEAKSRQTNIKMTARKLRRVINEVRGKAVIEAQDMLRFMPYFAARVVEKNLKAAVANAQEKFGVGAEGLKVSEILADKEEVQKLSNVFVPLKDVFFIGRGIDYSLCMEGSLKLKEVTYIHSDAYAAGRKACYRRGHRVYSGSGVQRQERTAGVRT